MSQCRFEKKTRKPELYNLDKICRKISQSWKQTRFTTKDVGRSLKVGDKQELPQNRFCAKRYIQNTKS